MFRMFAIAVLMLCAAGGAQGLAQMDALPPASPAVVSAALDSVEQEFSSSPDQTDVRAQYVAGNEGYYVQPKTGVNKPVTVDMGYEFVNYKYEETVAGRHFMDLTGNFHGLYGSVAWRPGAGALDVNQLINYTALDMRMAWASLDYDGGVSLWDSGVRYDYPLSYSGSPDAVFEARGLAGREYLWQGGRLLPYLGFGYRYLRDDSSEKEVTIVHKGETLTGKPGYKRISQYIYMPVGLDIVQSVAKTWKIGAKMEYDYLFHGKQESFIGSGDPLANRQDQGFGARASLSLEKDLKDYSLKAEPFVRYWDIAKSNEVDGGYEPDNVTREIGMKLGISF